MELGSGWLFLPMLGGQEHGAGLREAVPTGDGSQEHRAGLRAAVPTGVGSQEHGAGLCFSVLFVWSTEFWERKRHTCSNMLLDLRPGIESRGWYG